MIFDYSKSVRREEGLAMLLERWPFAAKTETVPLAQAFNRVTAEDILSKNTLPVCRSSCFDGIAVRAADFKDGLPDVSTWKKGRDFVRADTGDDFPDAFDTVIAIEDILLEGDSVRFREGFVYRPEETVDPAGSIVQEGALLVKAHTRLTPQLLAALAIGGVVNVPVIQPVRVGFIPTGDELVPPQVRPERGQNVEANGVMLSSLLQSWGAETICYPIVPDKAGVLEKALDQALSACDIVLINGGSSKGEADYNSRMLQQRSSFFRHGVRTVPGRPVGMSIIDDKPVINIPGPVLAAYLCAYWLVSGLVAAYYGLPAPKAPTVTAKLAKPLKKRQGFELMARVRLEREPDGSYTAHSITWDHGLPAMLRETDGYVSVPEDCPGYPEGTQVQVQLLKGIELLN